MFLCSYVPMFLCSYVPMFLCSYVLVETMKTEAYQNAESIGITQYHYIYNILTAVNQFSGNNSTIMIPQKFWVEKH